VKGTLVFVLRYFFPPSPLLFSFLHVFNPYKSPAFCSKMCTRPARCINNLFFLVLGECVPLFEGTLTVSEAQVLSQSLLFSSLSFSLPLVLFRPGPKQIAMTRKMIQNLFFADRGAGISPFPPLFFFSFSFLT